MKLRKLTALGMAAVMTMSLAACGSSNSTNTEAPAATTDTATDAAASTTAEAAADTDAAAVPTYASIKLGEDYTDLTASISFMHHKTDREEDGTMAKLIEEFNKVYPNNRRYHRLCRDSASSSSYRGLGRHHVHPFCRCKGSVNILLSLRNSR